MLQRPRKCRQLKKIALIQIVELLPIPIAAVKAMSLLVDSLPSLRRSAPRLTRDRAKEIWADRWVVDSTSFRRATGWQSRQDLAEALNGAFRHYVREGHLPSP